MVEINKPVEVTIILSDLYSRYNLYRDILDRIEDEEKVNITKVITTGNMNLSLQNPDFPLGNNEDEHCQITKQLLMDDVITVLSYKDLIVRNLVTKENINSTINYFGVDRVKKVMKKDAKYLKSSLQKMYKKEKVGKSNMYSHYLNKFKETKEVYKIPGQNILVANSLIINEFETMNEYREYVRIGDASKIKPDLDAFNEALLEDYTYKESFPITFVGNYEVSHPVRINKNTILINPQLSSDPTQLVAIIVKNKEENPTFKYYKINKEGFFISIV